MTTSARDTKAPTCGPDPAFHHPGEPGPAIRLGATPDIHPTLQHPPDRPSSQSPQGLGRRREPLLRGPLRLAAGAGRAVARAAEISRSEEVSDDHPLLAIMFFYGLVLLAVIATLVWIAAP